MNYNRIPADDGLSAEDITDDHCISFRDGERILRSLAEISAPSGTRLITLATAV